MILKVFPCLAEYKTEILHEITDRGIVLFNDSNNIVQGYYQTHLEKELNGSVHLLYTNHPTEGCFYFLLNLDKFSYDEAKKIIKGSSLIFEKS